MLKRLSTLYFFTARFQVGTKVTHVQDDSKVKKADKNCFKE